MPKTLDSPEPPTADEIAELADNGGTFHAFSPEKER
jgi:hypothetical protein